MAYDGLRVLFIHNTGLVEFQVYFIFPLFPDINEILVRLTISLKNIVFMLSADFGEFAVDQVFLKLVPRLKRFWARTPL